MEWTEHGNWQSRLEKEAYKIFPKGKDDKRLVIWIRRVYLHLRRELKDGSFAEITFKYYLHQRHTYWSDSRHKKGSVHQRHVVNEVARLLFKKDKHPAQRLVEHAEGLLY